MYDNFKVANYNNSQLSPELYARPLSRLFTGEVIDGFTVVPKTGLTVTLQPGNAFVRYGSTDVASARLVSLVADFDLTHDTADASNPRIDVIVVYVDNGVSFDDPQDDGAGAAKAIIVKGTPNANPVAPNSTAIQSAVGASNPYVVVAQVRLDAGVTVVASNKITDARLQATVAVGNLNLADTEYAVRGQYFLGQQVYQRIVTFGALPNATSKSVNHNITSLQYVTELTGVAWTAGLTTLPLPFVNDSNSTTGQVALLANGLQVTITTSSNRTSYTTCYVILKYTKTA